MTVSWQTPESGDAPKWYIVHLTPDDGGKGGRLHLAITLPEAEPE